MEEIQFKDKIDANVAREYIDKFLKADLDLNNFLVETKYLLDDVVKNSKAYLNIEVENILRELKCFGLKGVEIYHPSHSQSDINKFFNLARKYKLSITGGSDYHGKQIGYENLSIGSYGLNQEYLEKFIKSNNK